MTSRDPVAAVWDEETQMPAFRCGVVAAEWESWAQTQTLDKSGVPLTSLIDLPSGPRIRGASPSWKEEGTFPSRAGPELQAFLPRWKFMCWKAQHWVFSMFSKSVEAEGNVREWRMSFPLCFSGSSFLYSISAHVPLPRVVGDVPMHTTLTEGQLAWLCLPRKCRMCRLLQE